MPTLELLRRAGRLCGEVKNARAVWRERAGLLVVLRDDAGRVGLGEASPLPGYSPDALEDVARALGALDVGDLRGGSLTSIGAALHEIPASLPSARFALETALLDLFGQVEGRPVFHLLGDAPAPAVPVAAVIAGDTAEALTAEAATAIGRGVRTLKVKIGVLSLAEDLGRLAGLAAALPPGVRLRLDANQQAHVPAAVLLRALAGLPGPIELVEEPGPIEDVLELDGTPLPIGLDESLQGLAGGAGLLARAAGLAAYAVLKPAALGGSLAALELARTARAHGMAPIVTHLFDGPVAHAAASHLALALGGEEAAGLDGHAGLGAWPPVEGVEIRAGVLQVGASPGLFAHEVRRALLEAVR